MNAARAGRGWRRRYRGITVHAGVLVGVLMVAGIVAAGPWEAYPEAISGGAGRLLRITLPAPAVLLVVPAMLVWLAAAAGVEMALRRPGTLWSLVPASVGGTYGLLLGRGQWSDLGAVVLAAGCAGWVLYRAADPWQSLDSSGSGRRRARRRVVMVAAGLSAVAATALLLPLPASPSQAPPYDVRDVLGPPPSVRFGINPIDRLAAWLSTPDDVLFTAKTDRDVALWQLNILDDYDGREWTSSARYLRAGLGLPPAPGAAGEPIHQEVRIDRLGGPFLPAAAHPVRINSIVPGADALPVTSVDVDDAVLHSDADFRPGLTYRVTSTTAEVPAPPLLSTLHPATGPDVALRVPPGLIGDLALLNGTVATKAGWYERATAVGERLRAQHYHVLTAPVAIDVESIHDFLVPGSVGSSATFATAFALAMRAAGIPARVVVGFAGRPAVRAADGTVTVRAGDALAWVQLRFDDVGWLAFLPTPAPTAAPPPRIAPPSQPPPIPGPALATSPSPVPTKVAGFRRVNGYRPTLLRLPWAEMGALLSGAAGGYLLAVLAWPTLRRGWRRGRGAPRMRLVRAWHDTLGELWLPAVHVPTPMTVRARIAQLSPDGHRANDLLARLADRALFDPLDITADQACRGWIAADDIRRRLRRNQPRWRRIAARIAPRNLRVRSPWR